MFSINRSNTEEPGNNNLGTATSFAPDLMYKFCKKKYGHSEMAEIRDLLI